MKIYLQNSIINNRKESFKSASSAVRQGQNILINPEVMEIIETEIRNNATAPKNNEYLRTLINETRELGISGYITLHQNDKFINIIYQNPYTSNNVSGLATWKKSQNNYAIQALVHFFESIKKRAGYYKSLEKLMNKARL